MKRLSPLLLFAACSLLAVPVLAADAPPLNGCAAKRQAISAQIEQAKANGNSAQQAGLEKALSEATANCTDASLLKQLETRVLDAKHEVARRQSDLDRAMSKGDPDKINTRKDKLAQARQELKDAHAELEKIEPDDD
ncbi:DUF1090 domain-containing protein [Pseudomonas sp. CCI3.2]|uniref:DUF1090 domain-containing protein n=1 Tax=unclassified Pseudomonas TaxID=196821 RepID=UPI002AC93FE8|nr:MULTISPECIES: DUF1090 domain-containing protein [unclassified Pseudomonas]MEB0077380.1 DUF1090 domain-containing protein [Pseudomonas sp. MH10out]MEB0101165.1 DUF1090 domain-containing protein [Pseudomonas sp. CCI3.2]MEB0129983.1 DUF1090 domain-containing protein [Pseudomonas sp. CCI2.4]MEB0157265.1 DUF1090 domain-containing protein [Pseudomonas sp. AH2 (2023)]MEB0168417.1 DUF1090 domain-containing protein [Pseudomonas sp. CCC4.4]